MTYQITEITAKPTKTADASGNQYDPQGPYCLNPQFMVSRVTGIAVGNDKSGNAKMYQQIATLLISSRSASGQCRSHIAECPKLALEERPKRHLVSPAKEANCDRN